MTTVLIANRGEIAIRIARAARRLGLGTVGVYAQDDAASLHLRFVDDARPLKREGAAAYLDAAALVAIAREAGASAVHPGYGFLSENADFARDCAAAGLIFVGPSPETLALFGDKIGARRFAVAHGAPVPPGLDRPVTAEEAHTFAERHGAVMLKAVAGGGGRGMRAVHNASEIDEAYARCASEARTAFGNGDLYVEKLIAAARHIEVQIVGDGREVRELGERDCSIQRRHQKLIEIAPAPSLDAALRQRMIATAVDLARAAGFAGLGTFEFLVSGEDFWFIEANPRLQVEHTVTEEVTGVDLVQAQLRIALGATLAEVGLAAPRPAMGFAIQARVNLESLGPDGAPIPHAGRLTAYALPSGPGVRVDGCGYVGYETSRRYDSLLAKVIAHGADFESARVNLLAALAEFEIAGPPTNLALLASLLDLPQVKAGRFDTSLVGANLPKSPLRTETGAVAAPMAGLVVAVLARAGQRVGAGEGVAVIEAMKMEHVARASAGGVVLGVDIVEGQRVAAGAILVRVATDDAASPEPAALDLGWAPEVAQIERRRKLALGMGGAAKLKRQSADGKLNARERIDALLDAGSFREIGALSGFVGYDEAGEIASHSPANFIAGEGALDGRRIALGVDDFTLRGGSGDAAIHAKQVFWEHYAGRMRLPMVRLLDGASGGGSVKMAQKAGYHYLPVNPAWDDVVENLSLIPVASAALGPTVGLGAARLVMSHFSVLVEGVAQVFTAGPPVVQAAMREALTKEQLGGADVHRENGVVERIVSTEREAFATIRAFLSYMPGSVFETPPIIANSDPCDRRDEALLTAVPRNERRPYDIDAIMEAIFDRGSILRYSDYGGATVTALARLDGRPVGVIATDPMKGVTMSVEGALAATRLTDLCETFHLPLVSLTDQGGVSIGLAAERSGAIRHGARAIAAIYQARIPQAELVVRRVFGVGGAGAINRHVANRSWCWPSGFWGSLPQKGGVEAAFRAELDGAADREAAIARIARELEAIGSPFRTAERFGVQDIIDPRDSRALLCDWVKDAWRVLPELVGRPAFGARP